MSETILPTRNTDWGFFGTMTHHADPIAAWSLAMTAISGATGSPDFAVRDFLDNRHGRHFGDDVVNGLAEGLSLARAIDAAIERWMGWTITGRIEREYGIPRGLPYLTGFVRQQEVEAELAA